MLAEEVALVADTSSVDNLGKAMQEIIRPSFWKKKKKKQMSLRLRF